MFDLKEVADVQEIFQKNLDRSSGTNRTSGVPGELLSKITTFSEEAVESYLGKFGKELRSFVGKVDLLHPDLEPLVKILSDANKSKKYCEFLDVADFARQKKLDSVSKVTQKFFQDQMFLDYGTHIIGKLSSPPVRTLLDKEREMARNSKEKKLFHEISLSTLMSSAWSSQPASMKVYTRFNSQRNQGLEDKKAIQQKVLQHGLTLFSTAIATFVKAAEQSREEKYCGFYRIGLSDSAVTLAKIHSCQFVGNSSVPVRWNGTGELEDYLAKTLIPNTGFRSYLNSLYDKEVVLPNDGSIAECLQALNVINENYIMKYGIRDVFQRVPLIYGPRLYKLGMFRDLMTSEMDAVVKRLESWPEMAGRPLFDHYIILVPGIQISREHYKQTNRLYRMKGQDKFLELTQLYYKLDHEIVARGLVRPILIGRRDEKHYFISYFLTNKSPEAPECN